MDGGDGSGKLDVFAGCAAVDGAVEFICRWGSFLSHGGSPRIEAKASTSVDRSKGFPDVLRLERPGVGSFLDATALQRRRRVGVPHLRKLVRRLRRGARSTPAKRRARRMQRRPRRRRGGDAPRVAALDRDIALKSTPVKGRRY